MDLLTINNLTRHYTPMIYKFLKAVGLNSLGEKYEEKIIKAVDGISFSIRAGEICGFLGPNGAGKSTTIKAIAGLIKYDNGEIYINGKRVGRDKERVNSDIGGVIESPEMYRNLSGLANLKYFSLIRGGVSSERILKVLKIVGLSERKNSKFSSYSMGMKQRLGIAQAILSKPKILLLDEPANGLDPQGIIDLRNLLRKLAHEENMAVLVSSHQLSEMQIICDRVIIMNRGQIIADKMIGELGEAEENKVKVSFHADDTTKTMELLRDKYLVEAEITDRAVSVYLDKSIVPEVTKELLINGIMVSGVKIHERTLEELFIELTKEGRI